MKFASTRQSISPIIGGGILIIISIIGSICWAVQQGKDAAKHSAEVTTANITRILVENINNTVEKIDLGILSVLDEINKQLKVGSSNEAALKSVISSVESRLPNLFGFRIFGPDGKLRYAISNVANPNSDLSKREDFITLRDHPEGGLVVSQPVFGATTQQWAIALARRINNPDGSFGGAVYGPIPIKALTKSFGDLQLGPGGTIAMYHASYKMAARFPEILGAKNPVGTTTISDRLREIIASGAEDTQYDYISTVDGVSRTANVRQIPGRPYIILAGLSEADYLADWRRDRNRLVLLGAFAVTLVLVGLWIVLRQISDRQRTVLYLKQANEALIDSKNKEAAANQSALRAGFLGDQALELARAGYWCVDLKEGNDYYISSERTVAIFGDPPRVNYRYHIMNDWYANIEAADKEAANATLANYLDAVEGRAPRYDMIHPYKRPCDGQVIWIHVLGQIIRDEKGNPTNIYGVVMDITQERHAQGQLLIAKNAAEQSDIAKSQFLANMSHEIRTPMNAILGLAYLLEQTNLDGHQKDYVQKTRISAQSLLGILNDILDLSKVQAGKIELIEEPFRLDDLIKSLATIAATNARDKDIEVLFDISADTPLTLIGDSLRLQQVLTNLAGNAIKFTERGEVVLSVEVVSSDTQTVDLLFRVRDTGVGIAPENLERIFEAFAQADNTTSRRYGGSGLGLAISRRLVELAGGRIWYESLPGQGSTFFVTLRFGRSSLVLEDPDPQQKIPADLKVLIADDNSTARKVLATMVATFGWKVVVASSGQQALEEFDRAIKSEPFDLLLLDWSMPGIGGNEIVRHIKAHHAPEDVPLILIVTAFEYERVRRDSDGEQLIRAVLTKPVTPSSLLDAVTQSRPTAPNVQALPPAKSHTASKPLVGLSLLVVEDNSINQMVARRILETAGATVVVAADGIKALEALSTGRHHFNAVLMDIQMPGMDGYDATRAIRNDLGLVDLPIIAMTANAMVSDREQCLAAGMNDHVGKPFVIEQMIEAIVKYTGHGAHHVRQLQESMMSREPLELCSAINIKEALTRTMEDRDLLMVLMNEFAQYYSDIASAFNKLIAEKNLGELSKRAHELRGVSANLGAGHLANAAKTLQVSAERGDLDQSKKACDDIRSIISAVIHDARLIGGGCGLDRP